MRLIIGFKPKDREPFMTVIDDVFGLSIFPEHIEYAVRNKETEEITFFSSTIPHSLLQVLDETYYERIKADLEKMDKEDSNDR